MYNIIIEILSGMLNIYGTVKTVLTVINIDFKNISIEATLEKLSHPEINIFTNHKNAMNGIAIIIVGFVLGVIEKFYSFDFISFMIAILAICFILYISRIYFYMEYIFLIQEYEKYLIRNNKPSLIDHLKDGEKIRTVKVPIKFNVNKYIKRLE